MKVKNLIKELETMDTISCECCYGGNCNNCKTTNIIREIQKQLEYRKRKKPIREICDGETSVECSTCGNFLDLYIGKYCDGCGQKIDWREDP